MTAEEIRAFFHDLSHSRFDAIAPRLADDVVFEFPGRRFGGRHEGKRRVLVFLKANQRLFTDGLAFTVHWVGIDGDRAVAQWTNAGGTREGSPYANRGVTIFRESSGRIVEIQDYLDTERIAENWPK
jgi:ketosteroid isomerase-like protein